MMSPAVVRDGTEADIIFLRKMLYEAAFWASTKDRPTIEEGLARPELTKILKDWGHHQGDTSVIAVSKDGIPFGAAWYRFWTKDNHSYGFVADGIPEISIAVVQEFRGYGVGRLLLNALIERGRKQKIQQLSLSVEQNNEAALQMYKNLGFRIFGGESNSWTMVVDLL